MNPLISGFWFSKKNYTPKSDDGNEEKDLEQISLLQCFDQK